MFIKHHFLTVPYSAGIYLYDKRQKGGTRQINPIAEKILQRYRTPGQAVPTTEDVQWRTYMRSVNEAALCLQEEIIANPVSYH